MEFPPFGPDSSPITSTVYSNYDEATTTDLTSVQFDQLALTDAMRRGDGGCNYEELEEKAGEEAVSVPRGGAHATQVPGWSPKYNPKEDAQLCARRADATEKRWELPAAAEATLRQFDRGLGGGSTRPQGDVAEEGAAQAAGANGKEEQEEADEKGAQELEEDTHPSWGAMQEAEDAEACANGVASVPPTSQALGRCLFSTCREHRDEDAVVRPVNGVHAMFLQHALLEGGKDATACLLEEEHVARCFLEEEEVGKRGALLNAIQWELNTPCRSSADAVGADGDTTPSAAAQASSPLLDATADDNELFLRNTRLSRILDDETVTPLEKLLRGSSPNAQSPPKRGSAVMGGGYADIYEPPSGTVGTLPAQTPSGASKVGLREKYVLQPSPSEASPSHLSPWRLLETQRHQLEMERLLTQRDRDNLERALDARYQCIQLPPDTHAQLRYEPSDAFTRERQLILGSLGIPGPKASPQADAAKPPQQEGKKGHHYSQQQQQQQEEQDRLQTEAHKRGTPGVGLSPISPHTLLPSPSPPKLIEPQPDPKAATLFAEACEAKYTEGLAAMKEILGLYQAFIRTQPQPNPPLAGLQFQANNSVGGEATASSTVTYERRLARIKHLYPSTDTNASVMHRYRRPLYTPPLPPSLEPYSFTDGASRNYANAPVKGAGVSFRASIGVSRYMGGRYDSGLAEYHLPTFGRPGKSVGSEYDGNRRTLGTQSFDAVLPPHRRIVTPPVLPFAEEQLPAGEVSVNWPLLRWDAERSGNVFISQNGTTCMADVSSALQLIAAEEERKGETFPSAKNSWFALGTIGIAEGEFIFEVRIDAQPSSTRASRGLFAVGVTTKYYRGARERSPAYLFRSDGTLVSHSDAETGFPYGCPYHSGSHVTVYLSLIKKELYFFLNGQALGVAFRFIGAEDPEPLFPLVVLGGEGGSATFVPPSAPQLPHQMSPSARQNMRLVKPQ
ncbi:uncharacterized protein Tco025E_03602 [Trypanosoma conorhini]|uniref:B30.2/SPRY domain-containing protein n=1 Tax=Trypanosoma conorhini TaxID=83891 RepID=A0A3R7PC30_9TRYP|nr:uncharacterized protein Tco025E_03602 [Trypanosoma conorhini]RNF21159.1 hypothetical protein Tco025E_03602 [Trypanosoma conorhini]